MARETFRALYVFTVSVKLTLFIAVIMWKRFLKDTLALSQ